MKYLLTVVITLIISTLLNAQEDIPHYTLEDSIRIYGVAGNNTEAPPLKIPISPREAPFSLQVTDRTIIDQQQANTLSDAMQYSSGINVQSNFGVHDLLLIRGFSALDNGLVLIDGHGEPEASFLYMYNVDRIEVIKGGGGFAYGANPLAGTVNIVRKKGAQDRFANLRFSAARFGNLHGQADLGFANAEQSLGFRLNTMYQSGDSHRDDHSHDVFAINPSAVWQPDSTFRVEGDIEIVNSSYTPDTGIPLIIPSSYDNTALIDYIGIYQGTHTLSFNDPADFSDQEVMRGRVSLSKSFDSGIKIRNQSYHSALDWRSDAHNILRTLAQWGQVARMFAVLDSRQTLTGNQLEAQFSREMDQVSFTGTVGLEAQRLNDETLIDYTVGAEVWLDNPQVPASTPSGNPIQIFYVDVDAQSTTLAPYAAFLAELGPRFDIFVGGRYDKIDYEDVRTDFLGRTVQGDIFLPGTSDASHGRFSPTAGFGIKIGSSTQVFGNFGQAFSPPSSLVGGSIEPEESQQLEAGIRQYLWNNRIFASATAFRINKDNIALRNALGVLSYIGEQRSQGVELDVLANLHSNTNLRVGYSFTDAIFVQFFELLGPSFVVDHTDNVLPYVPKHSLRAWLQHEMKNGVELGLGVRYTGEQYTSADNVFAIDAATILDASIAYDQPGWRASVNLTNLTDTETFTSGFSGVSVIPAMPFSMIGSVEIRL